MAKNGVTLRDLYDIANRLEEKLDDRLGKHEERISRIENNQSRAFGALSVLSLLVSSGASFLWQTILNKK